MAASTILTADERLRGYLRDLDAAIVSRGGQSIFAPRPVGDVHDHIERQAFIDWEHEKLGPPIPKADPDDGFNRLRYSRGKLHLVRKT